MKTVTTPSAVPTRLITEKRFRQKLPSRLPQPSSASTSWNGTRRTAVGLAAVLLLWSASVGVAVPSPPEEKKKKEKPYALIFGTVFGPDSRAVAGVKVKIRRSDQKKAKWELYSDSRGEFAVRVPPGKADYVIWADLPGPKDRPRPEVTAHVENDERVDIGLHLK